MEWPWQRANTNSSIKNTYLAKNNHIFSNLNNIREFPLFYPFEVHSFMRLSRTGFLYRRKDPVMSEIPGLNRYAIGNCYVLNILKIICILIPEKCLSGEVCTSGHDLPPKVPPVHSPVSPVPRPSHNVDISFFLLLDELSNKLGLHHIILFIRAYLDSTMWYRTHDNLITL